MADVVGTGGVLPRRPITLQASSPARRRGSSPRSPRSDGGPFTIDGDPPLRRRPMEPLHDALVALGATVEPQRRVGTPAGHRVRARCAARTR